MANALFLAVGAPEGTDEADMASGPEFQRFVEDLWAHQDPGGPGPTDEAVGRRWPEAPACPTKSRAGSATANTADDVDIEEMAAYNYGALIGIDPITTGTPTVYDLKHTGEGRPSRQTTGWTT